MVGLAGVCVHELIVIVIFRLDAQADKVIVKSNGWTSSCLSTQIDSDC